MFRALTHFRHGTLSVTPLHRLSGSLSRSPRGRWSWFMPILQLRKLRPHIKLPIVTLPWVPQDTGRHRKRQPWDNRKGERNSVLPDPRPSLLLAPTACGTQRGGVEGLSPARSLRDQHWVSPSLRPGAKGLRHPGPRPLGPDGSTERSLSPGSASPLPQRWGAPAASPEGLLRAPPASHSLAPTCISPAGHRLHSDAGQRPRHLDRADQPQDGRSQVKGAAGHQGSARGWEAPGTRSPARGC